MIRVCYYQGCGIAFGEKEPLSDKTITHGLCPKHYELALKELRAEMEKLINMNGGFKLLIVEDSILFRQLLKERLEDRFPSIHVSEANDGEEALEQIQTSPPDVIFMDIRLPGENGIEVTKRIKAQYPRIRVVILTSYDLPEYRDAAMRSADYFFSKDSLTTQSILALVESLSSGSG